MSHTTTNRTMSHTTTRKTMSHITTNRTMPTASRATAPTASFSTHCRAARAQRGQTLGLGPSLCALPSQNDWNSQFGDWRKQYWDPNSHLGRKHLSQYLAGRQWGVSCIVYGPLQLKGVSLSPPRHEYHVQFYTTPMTFWLVLFAHQAITTSARVGRRCPLDGRSLATTPTLSKLPQWRSYPTNSTAAQR